MNSPKPLEVVDTREKLAQIAQVSHDTIARVKKIEQKATEEIKHKLERGGLSIHEPSIRETKYFDRLTSLLRR